MKGPFCHLLPMWNCYTSNPPCQIPHALVRIQNTCLTRVHFGMMHRLVVRYTYTFMMHQHKNYVPMHHAALYSPTNFQRFSAPKCVAQKDAKGNRLICQASDCQKMGHHQKEQMLHFEQRTYQSRIQVWFCWKAIWSKPSQSFYKTSLFNHEGANHTYVYLRMYNMAYNPTWLRNEPYRLIGVWGIDPWWPHDPMEGCSHLLGALQSHLQLQNRLIFATPEQCTFIHVCQEDLLRAKSLLNSLAATTSLANKNGYYMVLCHRHRSNHLEKCPWKHHPDSARCLLP